MSIPFLSNGENYFHIQFGSNQWVHLSHEAAHPAKKNSITILILFVWYTDAYKNQQSTAASNKLDRKTLLGDFYDEIFLVLFLKIDIYPLLGPSFINIGTTTPIKAMIPKKAVTMITDKFSIILPLNDLKTKMKVSKILIVNHRTTETATMLRVMKFWW